MVPALITEEPPGGEGPVLERVRTLFEIESVAPELSRSRLEMVSFTVSETV